MAGYSGTPLAKKLGIKPWSRILVRGASADYEALLAPLPESATVSSRLRPPVDIIHFFTKSRSDLDSFLERAPQQIHPDGALWISWPKKASGVPTDVTEDTIRSLALRKKPRGHQSLRRRRHLVRPQTRHPKVPPAIVEAQPRPISWRIRPWGRFVPAVLFRDRSR